MTQYYHTPIPTGASADALTFRSPMGELDAAIYRVLGSGTSFPGSPNEGDMFYRTDSNTQYIYKNSSWVEMNTGGSTAGVVDVEGEAGENLNERDFVYLATDGTWYRVDIDATATVKLSAYRGFVAESGGVTSGSTGTIRRAGVLGGFSGLTPGGDVFGTTTLGGYTQTKPAVTDGGAQLAIVRAGRAISATEVLIAQEHVDYCKRSTLANNATLTVEHHNDSETRTRQVFAMVVSEDTGETLAEYAETNQDYDVWLEGGSGAGGTSQQTSGTATGAIGNSSNNNVWEVQTFQVTAGRVTQFTAYFGANVGSPTGDIAYRIYPNTPDTGGTVLASGTFTPTPSSDNTVTLSNGPVLKASTTYSLELSTEDAQTNGNYFVWYNNTSGAYGDGSRWTSTDGGSNWSEQSSHDLRFSVTTAAETEKDRLAQGVQFDATTAVSVIRLYLKKFGAPTGTLTAAIFDDSGGDPNSSLTSATIGESTLATSYGWIEFTLGSPWTPATSTQYHVVLDTDRAADPDNCVAWGADASSPSYPDGTMKSEVAASWGDESKDACFELLAAPIDYLEPCVMGRYTGGTRDVAVRYDDAASPAADAATKTTFKNVIGSSADIIVGVRL